MTKKLIGILIAALLAISVVPAALFAQGERTDAPARDAAELAFWDFSTDPEADGWTFSDEDGDGYNWLWVEDTAAGNPIAASETHTLRSFSYYSAVGALSPDNWAMTPAIDLPEGEATLSYMIASYSGSYPETYRIYVFVDGADEPIALTEDLTSPNSIRIFEERTLDLSEFAGQTIKVAFRHYNCTDQFRVYLDDVAILSGEAAEPTEPPVTEPPAEPIFIENIEIENFVEPAWGEHPFFDVTVPEDAHYSLLLSEWRMLNPQYQETVLSPDDVFDNENNAYYQYFRIVPDEGYTFSTATTITINGLANMTETQSWLASGGYYWAYTIDFFVTEPAGALIGDVDLDGDVDISDALLVMRYMMGIAELTDEQLAQAEVDGDGEVSMVDCLLIQRRAMEVIGSFPVEQP